jgi:hypothetical protein
MKEYKKCHAIKYKKYSIQSENTVINRLKSSDFRVLV